MNRFIRTALTVTALALVVQPHHACAGRHYYQARSFADRWAATHASRMSWHDPYYHRLWGRPVPLVVPPTASSQSNWTWGVTGTETTPIYHQFGRSRASARIDGGAFQLQPAPHQPRSTRQLGVYYIRAPW